MSKWQQVSLDLKDSSKFSSYNVWKDVRYPNLINCQPGVITQFR